MQADVERRFQVARHIVESQSEPRDCLRRNSKPIGNGTVVRAGAQVGIEHRPQVTQLSMMPLKGERKAAVVRVRADSLSHFVVGVKNSQKRPELPW
jgi:hypothetical protein